MSQHEINAAEPVKPGMGPARLRPRTSRLWAVAAVVIVFMLLVGIPIGYMAIQWTRSVRDAPRAISRFVSDAVRPKFSVQQIVVSAVDDVHHQSKLVVLNAQVTADVTRQEGSASWGIYWGTNTARVMAKDAKVQYFIDLSGVSTADFVYDDSRKVMVVTVPRPRLDTQMVSIDPSKIETLDLSGGWMRWNKQETWEHAVAELVPQVLVEAGKPLVRKEADEAGKEAMLGVLGPMADALGKGGVTVDVRYRE